MKTRVVLHVDCLTADNTSLNDVIGMVARLCYLLRKVQGLQAHYYVGDPEQEVTCEDN